MTTVDIEHACPKQQSSKSNQMRKYNLLTIKLTSPMLETECSHSGVKSGKGIQSEIIIQFEYSRQTPTHDILASSR